MRRYAPSRWPTLLAFGAALVGAVTGWLLVRREVAAWESGGFTAGPEMGFVVFLAVALAVATWFIARRIIDGPSLSRSGWSLSFSGLPRANVGDLRTALERRGYTLEISELDDAAEIRAAAAPDAPLAGTQLALVVPSRRLGRARVILRLSRPDSDGGAGLGLVESEDASAGYYEELAKYVIAALAELVPGILYKGADSALDPEPAEALRALLPETPQR